MDAFVESKVPKKGVRDAEMKEFLEKALGGGRVASQKQFLDNDRKVLRFFCKCEDLPYTVHYFLADDTVEIREMHFPNNGRDQFPVLLRRQKLQKSFGINQPGSNSVIGEYLTCDQIDPGQNIHAYGRLFRLQGVDDFTQLF